MCRMQCQYGLQFWLLLDKQYWIVQILNSMNLTNTYLNKSNPGMYMQLHSLSVIQLHVHINPGASFADRD